MAPRSQLEIFTSSVQRLTKEEASYHNEIKQQTERVQKLETQNDGDENREYTLNQEVCELFRCFVCHWIERALMLSNPSVVLSKRRRMFYLA